MESALIFAPKTPDTITPAEFDENIAFAGFEKSYVEQEEAANREHFFDIALKHAITQEERYFLLGRLFRLNTTRSKVYKKTACAIAVHCVNEEEIRSLHNAIAATPQLHQVITDLLSQNADPNF